MEEIIIDYICRSHCLIMSGPSSTYNSHQKSPISAAKELVKVLLEVVSVRFREEYEIVLIKKFI